MSFSFGAWLGTFPSVAALGMIWGIMAIGVFITYKILDIADLTVDGSFVTGAMVCVVMYNVGINIWIATLCAFIAGLLCGAVTGLLHTKLGIPAILAGILTQQSLWTINLLIGKNSLVPVDYSKKAFLPLKKAVSALGLTDLYLVIIVAVVILLLYWFFGTEIGASLRATGNNLSMSRAQGINTNFTKVLGLMISNGMVAMAGSLFAQLNNTADINDGKGAIVKGLAAVVIGEAIISKISSRFIPRLVAVVVGACCYFLIEQTVVIFFPNLATYLRLFSAIIIACFLGAPYVKKTYFKKSVKGGKKNA